MKHDNPEERQKAFARGKQIGEGLVQAAIILSTIAVVLVAYHSEQSQSVLTAALATAVSFTGLCFSFARVLDKEDEEFSRIVVAGEHIMQSAVLLLISIAQGYVANKCSDYNAWIIPWTAYLISVLSCIAGAFYFQDGFRRISHSLDKRLQTARTIKVWIDEDGYVIKQNGREKPSKIVVDDKPVRIQGTP